MDVLHTATPSAATARFLDEPNPIVLAVRRPGGSVALNPVWFEYRDGCFWLNARLGARWLAHLERERAASLLLIDPHDMYRVVRSETRLAATRRDGATEHLDSLSLRYRGESYRMPFPMHRVVVQLEPLTLRSTLDEAPRSR